jgi:hypothetical protein
MGRRASVGEGRWLGGGSIQLHPSAGGGWTAVRRAAATDRTGMAARTLSDEGDDPELTDRVGPPVSEREAMAKSDKRSRPTESNKRSMPDSLIGWAHLSVRGR